MLLKQYQTAVRLLVKPNKKIIKLIYSLQKMCFFFMLVLTQITRTNILTSVTAISILLVSHITNK